MALRKKVSEEELLKAELKLMDKQRENLVARLRRLAPVAVKTRNPPRQNLWMVIREHLIGIGGSDTLEGIITALSNAGHDLGKYPRRTIKQCVVSPHLRQVFATYYANGEEVVEIRKEAAKAIHYLPLPARKTAPKSTSVN